MTTAPLNRQYLFMLAALSAATLISAIQPYDMLTWFLEAGPVLIGLVLVIITYKRFPLTPLLYWLLLIHSLILLLGAHYTYARVPMGEWVQDWLDLERNHYDRLGHVAQGFIPAILTREILLRKSPLRPGKWLFFLSVCVCLAFSAFYEMLEWWAAITAEEASVDFLGTQGDVWDTQWDMFLAMLGAIFSQLLLAAHHDRALQKLLG